MNEPKELTPDQANELARLQHELIAKHDEIKRIDDEIARLQSGGAK